MSDSNVGVIVYRAIKKLRKIEDFDLEQFIYQYQKGYFSVSASDTRTGIIVLYSDYDHIDPVALTLEQFNEISNSQNLTFYDREEGRSHFITDALMPNDLPEGYTFGKDELIKMAKSLE